MDKSLDQGYLIRLHPHLEDRLPSRPSVALIKLAFISSEGTVFMLDQGLRGNGIIESPPLSSQET